MCSKNLLRLMVLFVFGSLAIVPVALGQMWTPQYAVAAQGHAGIFCVKAVDERTVWAGASGGVYLRTTDGGQNWTSRAVPGAEFENFYSLSTRQHGFNSKCRW